MADFGLTEEELQDAMNMEKVFAWKKSNDKCCRCGNSGTTHVDPQKYMFSCSSCASTHGGTRIGSESFGTVEMQELEKNYGKGAAKKSNPSPAPAKKSSVSPAKPSPQKAKKPARRRSPSPSESESEEEPRRKSTNKKMSSNRRGSDAQFEDAFNAAAMMDKNNPGMNGFNNPSNMSAFNNQNSGFDGFSQAAQQPQTSLFSQGFVQQSNPSLGANFDPPSGFGNNPNQQMNFPGLAMVPAQQAAQPAFFSGPPSFGGMTPSPQFGQLMPAQQQGAPNFNSLQPMNAAQYQPQILPPPSAYASNLHTQQITNLLNNPATKASNPFLSRLLPPPTIPQLSSVYLGKNNDPIAAQLLLQQHQAAMSNQMYQNAFLKSEPASAALLSSLPNIDPLALLNAQQQRQLALLHQAEAASKSAPLSDNKGSDWFN
eukprot:GDKJ01035624.1.p1 GENE.GDKJ01035624.1~~GDKJ01035624.1.p1  ORF type:complete len:428 (+),score=127.02 GDKJ01035624.1:27-1310(+)